MTPEEILKENARRDALRMAPYDQMTGEGCCGERKEVTAPDGTFCRVPATMLADPALAQARVSRQAWDRLRARHDFEFWCARCVSIKDKLSGNLTPLVLNRPQRRLTAELERQRTAGKPIRLIMLKARQWGGSTLVQMYMAWMQTVRRRNWHSLICAHVKDTAVAIHGAYSRMLDEYPPEMWEEEPAPAFSAYGRSLNTRVIRGRDCRVTVASSERPEAVRGVDYAMAHLSEVAFWADAPTRTPEDFVRAICGGIVREPDTLIVLESTANGVGNYFHSEWLRSRRGESDKTTLFVPWYEIDIYRAPVADPMALWNSLDDYERMLWERCGCTLEQIEWYRAKSREYPSREMMAAEFPTDDTEAFTNSGSGVFALADVERLRAGCRPPLMTGEVEGCAPRGEDAICGVTFRADPKGRFMLWALPEARAAMGRYTVVVDVGGRSAKSDFSVIAVIDCCGPGGMPEIVGQWRGHINHDLLAWKAAAIAQWYGEALLVIESNTLETAGTEGDHSLFILSELNHVYRNLYCRTVLDRTAMREESRPGFHTNTSTKPMVIDRLVQMVSTAGYIERDGMACDELAVYEVLPNGSYAAKPGHHDDILMTRAIGLYVAGCTHRPPHPPKPYTAFRALRP